MDDLISRKKLLKDLRGILDVLAGQGDPILAGVMARAIKCVEKQEAAGLADILVEESEPDFCKRALAAWKLFRQYYARDLKCDYIYNPFAHALHQTWKAADRGEI